MLWTIRDDRISIICPSVCLLFFRTACLLAFLSVCQPASASLSMPICLLVSQVLRFPFEENESDVSCLFYLTSFPTLFFFFCRHINSASALFLDFQDLTTSFFHITSWCFLSGSLITWELCILYAKENYPCRVYSILKNLKSRKQTSSSLCISLYFWLPYIQWKW